MEQAYPDDKSDDQGQAWDKGIFHLSLILQMFLIYGLIRVSVLHGFAQAMVKSTIKLHAMTLSNNNYLLLRHVIVIYTEPSSLYGEYSSAKCRIFYS